MVQLHPGAPFDISPWFDGFLSDPTRALPSLSLRPQPQFSPTGARFTAVVSLVFALCLESHVLAHEDLLARILSLTAQISTNQSNTEAILQRADLYRLHRNFQEAKADYTTAERSGPRSASLFLGQAQLQVDLGEDRAARLLFDQALKLSPTNKTVLLGRGRALARLGESKAAIADYTGSIASPVGVQAEEFLERASLQAAEFGPDEAIRGLDEGLVRLGWVVTLQQAALDYEMKRQKPEQALARLETILTRTNRKETWLVRKGEILLVAGKPSEARETLTFTLQTIEALPPRSRNSPWMMRLRAQVEVLIAGIDVINPVARK